MQELRKQIAEERQLQELKELQVKAGLVDKDQAQKLDWMYEGPMATMQDHQENTEQYLLGKEVSLKAQESEVKKVESQPGMLFLNSVSAKNDMFTRLHEDPLLLIKQNELKKREDVVKNPVKMARIRQQLEAEMAAKKEKKKRKKEKKRTRKEAKKAKKKDREREHSKREEEASSASSNDSSGDEVEDTRSGKGGAGEPPKRRRLDSRSRSPAPRRRSRSRSRERSSRGGGADATGTETRAAGPGGARPPPHVAGRTGNAAGIGIGSESVVATAAPTGTGTPTRMPASTAGGTTATTRKEAATGARSTACKRSMVAVAAAAAPAINTWGRTRRCWRPRKRKGKSRNASRRRPAASSP